jgi:hypothetical protein
MNLPCSEAVWSRGLALSGMDDLRTAEEIAIY